MPTKPCPGLARFPPESRLHGFWPRTPIRVISVICGIPSSSVLANVCHPTRKLPKELKSVPKKLRLFCVFFSLFLTQKILLYLPINYLRDAHFLRHAVLKSGGVAEFSFSMNLVAADVSPRHLPRQSSAFRRPLRSFFIFQSPICISPSALRLGPPPPPNQTRPDFQRPLRPRTLLSPRFGASPQASLRQTGNF